MRRSMTLIVMLIIYIPAFSLVRQFHARAATVQAASCSSADVQAAINAAQHNDVVQIPPGDCTWTAAVNLDVSAKALQVRGAGTDATKITASVDGAIKIKGAEGYGWALSELQFIGGTGNSIISITGTSKNWRLHHVKFSTTGGPSRLINVSGHTYGVIDHCEAIGTTPSEFVTVDGDDWPMWQRPQLFGDANAVYIEDNIISWTGHWEGRPALDGERGGRAVFRRNKVTNSVVIVHGYDTGGVASMMSIEVYDNEFIITDEMSTWAVLGAMRGGTGIWFNNKWTLGKNVWLGSPAIKLAVYRAGDGPYGWKYGCDGTEIRMCSNIDKNWRFLGGVYIKDCIVDGDCPTGYACKWKFCSVSRMNLCENDSDCPAGETCSSYVDGPGENGYPCRHQPGFSTHMTPEPVYGWNNTFTGSQLGVGQVRLSASVPQVREGRDYFNDIPKPGYQPYTYPHPLTVDGTSSPAPPSNLRIVK